MFRLSFASEVCKRLYKYKSLLLDKNAMFLFIALPELLIINYHNYDDKNIMSTGINIVHGTTVNLLALLFHNVLNSHDEQQIQANIANNDERPKTDTLDVFIVASLYLLIGTIFFSQNKTPVIFLMTIVVLYFQCLSKIFIGKELYAGFIATYVNIYNIGFFSRKKYRLGFDENHVLLLNCIIYSCLIPIQDIADIKGDRLEGRKTGIILSEDYFGKLPGNIIFRISLASGFLLYAIELRRQAIGNSYTNATDSTLLFCLEAEAAINALCALSLVLSSCYLLNNKNYANTIDLHKLDKCTYMIYQTSAFFWTTRSALDYMTSSTITPRA